MTFEEWWEASEDALDGYDAYDKAREAWVAGSEVMAAKKDRRSAELEAKAVDFPKTCPHREHGRCMFNVVRQDGYAPAR